MARQSASKPAAFQHDKTVGSEEWLTPKPLVDALDLPRLADVDPCSPRRRPWPTAKTHWHKAHDGLSRPWDVTAFYWVNPPYGAACRLWMAKAAAHGNGLLLIFARTDTRAFHESVWRHRNAAAVLFFEGRLRFATPNGQEAGSAGAPSALIAYGQKAYEALVRAVRAGTIKGRIVPLMDAGKIQTWPRPQRRFGHSQAPAPVSATATHPRAAAQRPARGRGGRAS
ncbi:hypothetical protein [Luteibacter sp. 9133]|uniref:hypothetical protein n=1 Tax=Luteibacter sp. 9133 TaxID=1500891 RepID=UPI00068B7432|nr:hypothetical protein [Luteibacter sp. 9133]